MTTAGFRFTPPDRRSIWKHLALTMSQTAALTGVSERQIQHWMDKGYILPAPDGARKVNGESLDAILLIKQARAGGIPLRQAVALAHAYLNREAAGTIEGEMARSTVQDLDEKLAIARRSITDVQHLLANMQPSETPEGSAPLRATVSDRVSSQRY